MRHAAPGAQVVDPPLGASPVDPRLHGHSHGSVVPNVVHLCWQPCGQTG
jgi:hypothetical protein